MADNKVIIDIIARLKGLADVDKLEAKLGGLSKSSGFKATMLGVGVGAGVKAFQMLDSAIGGVGNALMGAVQGAIDQETQMARLTQTLKANVAGWDGSLEAIERQTDGLTKLGFTNDELYDSLIQLIPGTKNVNEAFRFQAIAMDLARGRNISLQAATTKMTQALAGGSRILKELGIDLQDGASKAEIFAAVEGSVGGQAEKFAKTSAGAFATLQAELDQVSDDIGTALLPALKDLAIYLRDDVIPLVKDFGDVLGGLDDILADDSVLLMNFKELFIDWPLETPLARAVTDWLGLTNTAADRVQSLSDALDESNASWKEYAFRTRDMNVETDKAAKTARDAAAALIDMAAAASSPITVDVKWRTTYEEGRSLAQELKDLPDQIIVAKGDVGRAQKELEDARGREQHAAARLRLREAKREVERLEEQLRDATIKKNLAAAGKGLGAALGGGLYDEFKRWRDKTYHLAGTGGGGGGGGGPTIKPWQHGGPVSAGGSYLVGEVGPELFIPNQSGQIIPNNRLGMAGAMPLQNTIVVQVDGRELARVLDQQQYWALQTAPVSTRAS